MATNWPIGAADLRKALEFTPDDDDDEELALFAAAACERIDTYTGRDEDPERHLLANGDLPVVFPFAARRTAKLWWQQEKNGRRGAEGAEGRMGIDLPAPVVAMLAPYPSRPGFGS